MKKLVSLAGSGLACLLLLGAAHAQGVGSSGDIRGTVTDPSGAVVPNATVVVSDAAKGLRRAAQTDDAGQYQVTGLPPSTYDVSAEGKGFQTEVRKAVTVTIGQTAFADFQLSSGLYIVGPRTRPARIDACARSRSCVSLWK